jgi:two-component system, NarL family, response regulator DesR
VLLYGNTRLLIAEDEAMFRSILVRYCQNWGYTVLAECDNGREAIRRALQHPPDLALLDLEMPEYSGLEVAAAMRQRLPATKILLISAEIGPRELRLARKLGVNGVVDKRNESFTRLGEIIATILRGREYHSRSIIRLLHDEASATEEAPAETVS